jgi:serine/threonine-protein kinase HipA
MTVLREGNVFVRNHLAGSVQETDEGYRFIYNDEYLAGSDPAPVSLTLPIRKEPYVATTLFPFFDGLIPEGWLLSVVSRNWKIDSRDRFGLLLVACRDCVGNVSVQGVIP